MKVGDLCVFHWGEGVHVYLGEGGYRGWYRVLSLKTGIVSQAQRPDIEPVKKCPRQIEPISYTVNISNGEQMQKFKIGELVTLSSAGMKNGHNDGYYTGFGIVVEYVIHRGFPYKLKWFNKNKTNKTFNAKEYELKRYKVKK